MNDLIIRQVTPIDLESCVAVETGCFQPSEAAPRDSIIKRIELFPDGFLVADQKGSIIGMINSGATDKEDITDEELKKMIGHDPNGKNMVVFSLAVLPEFQGLGVSKRLMEEYVEASRKLDKKKILLICKEYHLDYYKKLGFSHGGPSKSSHGGFEWHEMVMDLAV